VVSLVLAVLLSGRLTAPVLVATAPILAGVVIRKRS
jgi:hypothetical protein